jgi:hypothetical protein
MKRSGALFLGLVMAFSVTVSVAGCGSSNGTNNQTNTPAVNSNAASAGTSESASKTSAIDPKTVDYSKVDVNVAFGDTNSINEIASNMWFGNYDGQVVKVEGYAEHLGSNWSIMEDKGDGSKIGFNFVLVGSEDYPVDGSHVELLGVIAPGGTMEGARVLYVLPENVKTLS